MNIFSYKSKMVLIKLSAILILGAAAAITPVVALPTPLNPVVDPIAEPFIDAGPGVPGSTNNPTYT